MPAAKIAVVAAARLASAKVAAAKLAAAAATAASAGAAFAAPIVGKARGAVDLPLAAAAILLVAGLTRGWVQPSLHAPRSAFELDVVLPLTGSRPVSWGMVVLLAVGLLLVAQAPWGRRRPAIAAAGAALALSAVAGFLVQALFVDERLQRDLARDRADLADLQRISGFAIPRPTISTLGPLPLPPDAALAMSAVRSGVLLAAAGAAVAVWTAMARATAPDHVGSRAEAKAGRRTRKAALAAFAAVALVVGATAAESALAHRSATEAGAAFANGDDAQAARLYRQAHDRAPGLSDQPDRMADYGAALLTQGRRVDPAAALAVSRGRRDAGQDLAALSELSDAIGRWPGSTALQDEFVRQAIVFLRLRTQPDAVHEVLPAIIESPVLRLALSRAELVVGDNPSAIADARIAIDQADDPEIHSVALTFASIAQTRSGDPVAGRKTLLEAVDADRQYVNVMARSLLAGLYTTLPI